MNYHVIKWADIESVTLTPGLFKCCFENLEFRKAAGGRARL